MTGVGLALIARAIVGKRGSLTAASASPARRPRCVPPIPEAQAYVADILGLLAGAGDPAGAEGLTVRLVW